MNPNCKKKSISWLACCQYFYAVVKQGSRVAGFVARKSRPNLSVGHVCRIPAFCGIIIIRLSYKYLIASHNYSKWCEPVCECSDG